MNRITNADYLKGNFAQIVQSLKQGSNVTLLGATLPIKTLSAATLPQQVLYVTADYVAANRIYTQLSQLREGVYLFPEKYDYLLYNAFAYSETTPKRIETLAALINGDCKICVATVDSLLHYLPNKQHYGGLFFTLSVGETVEYNALALSLVKAGYERVDKVDTPATFSMKGDTIDVFPVGQAMPYRVILFGDEIESIKKYYPDTMVGAGTAETELCVLPVSDMALTAGQYLRAMEGLQRAYKRTSFSEKLTEISEDIGIRLSSNAVKEALWWLTPFCNDELSLLTDYLSDDAVIWMDESKQVFDKADLLSREFKERVKTLQASHEVFAEHAKLLVPFERLLEEMRKHRMVASIPPISLNPLFKEGKSFEIKTSPIPAYYLDREQLLRDLDGYSKRRYTVLLCCGDYQRAKAFCEGLVADSAGVVLHREGEPLSGIMVSEKAIDYGFNIASAMLVVIGTRELFHKTAVRQVQRSIHTAFTVPKEDDYVVHDIHGVGQCEGVKTLKFGDNLPRDYVVIRYKGADKLYVPVEDLNRLSKYVAVGDKEPVLNSLGGRQFEQTVKKVKESIKKMSINLLDLYSQRSKLKGHRYAPDTSLQMDFECTFPFEETPDQLKAIEDVKADLEGGKIMDRLLCGDVGYGKTEVAVRAIFKVVQEGKQCALLVPTTLLALQHFNLLKDRFADFGIRVEMLSRFVSKSDIAAVLRGLKAGTVDVVIGTHRLLSGDVEFADLGLLVLDEEQRFGVEHKEKIKALRHNVNVLSMSATPIPRTLNLALNGIRDISVLDTPPVNRLPVQTFVTEYSDSLVQDAVNREIARGGQVFILHNRVQNIDLVHLQLQRLVPNARIIVAHGQLPGEELERRMAEFYNKQADVLLCTTIIENGIDLPDANTLIVCDADKLGLAELYQLRGRVGRSPRLAYAYFTVRSALTVGMVGEKRLNAIAGNTELGSGFKIAMADLEIRGAGDILGARQSGHIAKVGYDMYCKLLAESVAELQGVTEEKRTDAQMQVEVNTVIDDSTADALGGKLRLYKRIAACTEEKDKQRLLKELSSCVRVVPEAVENLIDVSLAKHFAEQLSAVKVVIGRERMYMELQSPEKVKDEGLVRTILARGNQVNISIDAHTRVVFNLYRMNNRAKLKYFVDFAQHCVNF